MVKLNYYLINIIKSLIKDYPHRYIESERRGVIVWADVGRGDGHVK